MRTIHDDKGQVYMTVECDGRQLKMTLTNSRNISVHLDAKVIPQLAALLREAEFFKTL
jgi:hypothetical protein